jgi:hypothetical protein
MSGLRCLLIAAILVGVAGSTPSPLRADVHAQERGDTDAPDWEQLALNPPILKLFTPSSGALLARSASELFRSDDAGASWRAVSLPSTSAPQIGLVTVDPTNHDVLYAELEAALFASRDGGANWQRLGLGFENRLGIAPVEHLRALEISPAEPSLLYASLAYDVGVPRFLRSRDSGATWTLLEGPAPHSPSSGCLYILSLLRPHATDPMRLFRSDGCGQGYGFAYGHPLRQSTNQGASWSTLYQRAATAVNHLVGGQGSMPTRWYISTLFAGGAAGGTVARSDDDGASWQTVLEWRPDTPIERGWSGTPGAMIGGLAYDPFHPDTVFVGMTTPDGGVRASTDGGASWTELGQHDIGSVQDLAVGIDGRNVYAATDLGLWRLALTVW